MPRGREKKERYCICNSTDGSGFMIACDACGVWFHGRCINMTKAQGDKIDRYFCMGCMSSSKGQCVNPICVKQRREKSKYCSDECGMEFNKKRYNAHFLPKWNMLRNDPSHAKNLKLSEMRKLETEIRIVEERIGRLRREKEQLEQTITLIKSDATKKKNEYDASREKSDEMETENEDEDPEEIVTSDQTKTFCLICGTEQLADKALKHWLTCHRRQESQYNFTSDLPMNATLGVKDHDEFPKLYCEKEDKKTKRYCMNIGSSCPQHSNWHCSKDEVCACPLNVMQDLKADGSYCLEYKKDCGLHYNWDKFRVATKDMERFQAFTKLADLRTKLDIMTNSLRNTYGGIVGIMLHDTKDFPRPMLITNSDESKMMIDVEEM